MHVYYSKKLIELIVLIMYITMQGINIFQSVKMLRTLPKR